MTEMNDSNDTRVKTVIFSRKDNEPQISDTRVLSTQPVFACFTLRGLPSVSHTIAKMLRSMARESRTDQQESRDRVRATTSVTWAHGPHGALIRIKSNAVLFDEYWNPCGT